MNNGDNVVDLKMVPFILIIDPSGEGKIYQNTMTNADIVRHLKFIASWIDSLPEDIGYISPGETSENQS